MPVVELNINRIRKLVSGKTTRKQVLDILPFLGLDIESEDGDEIRIEYSPNRPDYSTDYGIATGLQGLLGIKKGIQKIQSSARLQEIKFGKLKNFVKNNQLFVDGSHNPLGAKVLNKYLKSLDCKKHIILGMMANKDHNKYMSYFENIESLTTIDIPNQSNAIKGKDLKDKIKGFSNIQNKDSIEDAISSISIQKNDIILITGSLYLAGEVLNLN